MNLMMDKLHETETYRTAKDIGKTIILAGDFSTCQKWTDHQTENQEGHSSTQQ